MVFIRREGGNKRGINSYEVELTDRNLTDLTLKLGSSCHDNRQPLEVRLVHVSLTRSTSLRYLELHNAE